MDEYSILIRFTRTLEKRPLADVVLRKARVLTGGLIGVSDEHQVTVLLDLYECAPVRLLPDAGAWNLKAVGPPGKDAIALTRVFALDNPPRDGQTLWNGVER